MRPKNFKEENFTFTAPKGMDNCGDLPVFKGSDSDNIPVIVSCWELSQEEIDSIIKHRQVWLTINGVGMPPVSITAESPFQS